MGLQLSCFLCFDGLLVGGYVQFSEEEEEEEEALKRIEDIFAMAVERKKKTFLQKLAIGVAHRFVFQSSTSWVRWVMSEISQVLKLK